MKKSELKKLIKPIVKECIQEALLEDGILSRVISEVVMGLNSTNNLIREEKKISQRQSKEIVENGENEALKNMKVQRQQMLDAIGGGSYNGVNLFEGTDPLSSAGEPGAPAAPSSPLSGVEAKDPGVDISSLIGEFGNTWRAINNG